jgi:hypothetical protein
MCEGTGGTPPPLLLSAFRHPSPVICHVVHLSFESVVVVGRCRHLHDIAVSTHIPPYEQWLITAGAGAGSISSLVSSVSGAVAGSTRVPPYEQWLITAGAGAGSISLLVLCCPFRAAIFTKSPAAPAFPVRAGAHNGGGGYWVNVGVLELLGW